MLNLKSLGTGCANYTSNHKLVEEVAKTKGVVIDGKVLQVGGNASRSRPEVWLA